MKLRINKAIAMHDIIDIDQLIKDGYAEEILESVPTPKPQKPSERIEAIRKELNSEGINSEFPNAYIVASIIRYLDEIHENTKN